MRDYILGDFRYEGASLLSDICDLKYSHHPYLQVSLYQPPPGVALAARDSSSTFQYFLQVWHLRASDLNVYFLITRQRYQEMIFILWDRSNSKSAYTVQWSI